MRKGKLFILSIIILIILTGCHFNPEPKKTSFGELSLTLPPFIPRTGSSPNYPHWPLLWKVMMKTNTFLKNTSSKQSRFIPPGTKSLRLALYNTTNMWAYSDRLPLQSTPVTYTLGSIPAGSNYTLEVFSSFNDVDSMAIGRKAEITVKKDTTTTINLELAQPSVTDLVLPTEVQGGQPFSVQGQVQMPIDLQTSALLLPDEQHMCSVALCFMSISSNPPIGIILVYEKNRYSFIADQQTSITIDDGTLYLALSEEGELIPDAGPVLGTYILYCAIFPYEQPLTRDLYSIVCVPSELITIQVN